MRNRLHFEPLHRYSYIDKHVWIDQDDLPNRVVQEAPIRFSIDKKREIENITVVTENDRVSTLIQRIKAHIEELKINQEEYYAAIDIIDQERFTSSYELDLMDLPVHLGKSRSVLFEIDPKNSTPGGSLRQIWGEQIYKGKGRPKQEDQNKITLKEISERSGVSQPHVSDILNSKENSPSISVLNKIVYAFGGSIWISKFRYNG